MIVCAHQPVYLPGIIFFNKLALSDVCVMIGHVQMERTSWQTRNCVRTPGGNASTFLSIQIQKAGRFGQSINETQLVESNWRQKHERTIFYAYKQRPYFDHYFDELVATIKGPYATVSELNVALIEKLCEWLNISTRLVDSRTLEIEGRQTEMLVSLCTQLGASGYVSNVGSADYMEIEKFDGTGISHLWQVFEHPVYDQGDPFLQNLSVIDLLFNVGPESSKIIRNAGHLADTI